MDNGNHTVKAEVVPLDKAMAPAAERPRMTVIKAIAIQLKEGPTNTDTGRSNVQIEDPELSTLIATGRVIVPPFDPLILAMLPENSTILEQCIASMELNIDGFGHRFVPRIGLVVEGVTEPERAAARSEHTRLTNLFRHFCGDISFTGFRRRLRRDLECTGNAYFEVVRNRGGNIDKLTHVPSYQMRLAIQDAEWTVYNQERIVVKENGIAAVETVLDSKRFRRYVQFARLGRDSAVQQIIGMPVWFKELDDPRDIDAKTGDVLTKEQVATNKFMLATPMVHFKIYCPRSPYGIPRYIGNLITLFGDREADNVNFTTLKCNNVPSMIISVSNGMLTDPSINRIKEYVESQIQGSRNYSKFLILEAESPYAGEAGEGGAPRIDIKPLASVQTQDQLFQIFGENNRSKVRESFRLPPIFVGRAETYNRATAETSRKLADEQVFAPERMEFDFWVNNQLFPKLGVVNHSFMSMGPNVTDDEDLIKVLVAAEKTGGMTPRIAREIIEDIMGRQFAANWKIDPDIPLTLQLAEAAKNLAPVTVGSQVTALKSMEDPDALLSQLLELRESFDAEVTKRSAGRE